MSEIKHEVLGLRAYINTYFNGCQTEFAKSCGKSPKHIWRQLQSCEYIVVNHSVCQIKYSVSLINKERRSLEK